MQNIANQKAKTAEQIKLKLEKMSELEGRFLNIIEQEEAKERLRLKQSFEDKKRNIEQKLKPKEALPAIVAKSLPAASMRPRSLYEQIIEVKQAPEGRTPKEIEDLLHQKIKISHQIINENLRFEAGKPSSLFGKKVVILIDHIVNIYPFVRLDRKIEFKGGHLYDTLNNFMFTGIIDKGSEYLDENSKCYKFSGYNIVNGQNMLKTSFPKDWSARDVYQAIITSEKISETVEPDESLIITARVNHRNSKFMITMLLHKRQNSDIFEMVTAYPIVVEPESSSTLTTKNIAKAKNIPGAAPAARAS